MLLSMPRKPAPLSVAEPDDLGEPDIIEELDAMLVADTPEGDVYDVPRTDEGAYVPTQYVRRMVARLRGINVSDADIARLLKMSPRRLRLHYGYELETGLIRYSAKVAAVFHDVATDPTHKDYGKASTFWLERVGGWTKKLTVKHEAGAGGGEMPVIDSRRLTPDERDTLRALLAKATSDGDPALLAGPVDE